jgi:thioredoxin 1
MAKTLQRKSWTQNGSPMSWVYNDPNAPVWEVTDSMMKSDELKIETGQDGILKVVLCYANWCGPCRIMLNYMNALGEAEEYKDKAGFFKLNVDDNVATAGKYNVRAIPHTLFFLNGEVIKHQTGTLEIETITQHLLMTPAKKIPQFSLETRIEKAPIFKRVYPACMSTVKKSAGFKPPTP